MSELVKVLEEINGLIEKYCAEKCVVKNCGACHLGEVKAKLEVARALAEKLEEEVESLGKEVKQVKEKFEEVKERVTTIEGKLKSFEIDWDRVKRLPWRWGRRRGVKVIGEDDLRELYPELLAELKDRGQLKYRYSVIKYYPRSGKIVLARR